MKYWVAILMLVRSVLSGTPFACSAKDVSRRPAPNTIVPEGNGQIFLDGVKITLPEMQTRLEEMEAADPTTAFVVSGDGQASYNEVMNILHIRQKLHLQKLHLNDVGLATVSAGSRNGASN